MDLGVKLLRCMRCCKPVALYDSIGETLLHAPTAKLYHWNIIQFHNKQNHRESMSTPLLFTSYENYLRSSKSFQVSLNWIEKFGCQKPTKYGQFMFYEAVKNDMANFKETSFNNTIRAPLGARAYPWILSKYFPCIRPSVCLSPWSRGHFKIRAKMCELI